jgi:hypothetical protein
MRKDALLRFCLLLGLSAAGSLSAADSLTQNDNHSVHEASQIGSGNSRFVPDISVIANLQTNFSDNKDDFNRDKIWLKEGEIAFQGYVYPAVRTDVIVSLEQEYTEEGSDTTTHLEEGNLSFLELPYGLQACVGRQLVGIGKLNRLHPHHWAFADRPLVNESFFGEENWSDDGLTLDTLISNPWDLYLKVSGGLFNGRRLGEEEEDETEAQAGPIQWQGRVYLGRASLSLPLNDVLDTDLGYSFACDSGQDTIVHGADLTFTRRWPNSYRRLVWQTEYFHTEVDANSLNRGGLYSMVLLTLDKYCQIGLRGDWSQTLATEEQEEWAISPFATYFFNESFYVRAQYRYRQMPEDHEPENALFLQLVWGLGPHSHRLED